jgi:hypothetical protein
MPLAKRPTKKAAENRNKCPWCAARSYKEVEKLNIFQKIRYAGCKLYVCLKCGKKWAV